MFSFDDDRGTNLNTTFGVSLPNSHNLVARATPHAALHVRQTQHAAIVRIQLLHTLPSELVPDSNTVIIGATPHKIADLQQGPNPSEAHPK